MSLVRAKTPLKVNCASFKSLTLLDPADEDEIGEADNPEWEKEFLQLLPRIAKKDPVLYKKEKEFFHEVEQKNQTCTRTLLINDLIFILASTKPEPQKPLRLAEYVTSNLMETEGKEIDERKEMQNFTSNSSSHHFANSKKNSNNLNVKKTYHLSNNNDVPKLLS